MSLTLQPQLRANHSRFLPFTPNLENDYTLQRHRIDIWQYSLKALRPEAFALLNTKEQHRAKRYHFSRHQRRFTMARAILRVILARYQQVDPKSLEFIENQYGKPSVAGAPFLHFNLSHSQDLALLGIGYQYPLGIDLEYFANRSLTGISELMFSSAELASFSETITANRSLSFFHIWAQKEAFIKACGMGLSYPTQQFDVPHMPPTDQQVYDPKHDHYWQMKSFMPEMACCAALCCHSEITEFRFQTLEQDTDVFT